MSWRNVIISHRCKLDYKIGYLVIRGEDVKRVFLDEVAMILLENPAVSLTGCLVEALTAKKVKVIFCDGKHNPVSELAPYHAVLCAGRGNGAVHVHGLIARLSSANAGKPCLPPASFGAKNDCG